MKAKSKLFLSVLFLIASVLLCVGGLYAWFVTSRAPGMGDFDIAVMGNLVDFSSASVYKKNADETEFATDPASTYRDGKWTNADEGAAALFGSILDGDEFRFDVTLSKNKNSPAYVQVSALFSGISILQTKTIDGASETTEWTGWDETMKDPPDVTLKDLFHIKKAGQSDYGASLAAEGGRVAAENLQWDTAAQETFHFSFYLKFHNGTLDEGYSGRPVPTVLFKGQSISIRLLQINVR